MRAVICHAWSGYRGLSLEAVSPPPMRAGCVRIAVHYATVSFGQLLVVAGTYQRRPPLPFTPGTEVAGIVLEVAPDVQGFAPGDRVAASLDWGGYADEAIATADTVWHMPASIPLASAVSIPLTYGTAYAALHWRARLQPGDTLLVHGAAGGVGLAAVELGRLAGAHVIAVASSPERLALARAHGAAACLQHGEPGLAQRVMAANGGRPVDVVFDPVGGALFDEALHAIAPEGRIVLIGFASGDVPQIRANHLLVKNAEVLGFYFGQYLGWGRTDERSRHAPRLRAMMQTLADHVVHARLVPTSSVCFPLEQFAQAYAAVEGRQSTGRALLQIAPEPDVPPP